MAATIPPVDVLDRDVHGLRAAQLREGVAECVEEPATFVLRLERLQRALTPHEYGANNAAVEECRWLGSGPVMG